MKFNEFDAIPMFRIFDEAKAKEFYVDFMGFTVDWEHRFADDMPLYMQVSRGNLVLHLTEHHGDCTPGAKAFVRTGELKKLHEEISAKDYRYLNPGYGPAPWGGWCMEVADPFGNKILFAEYEES